MSIVKDQNLAPAGRRKINWVRDFMPALGGIEARFEQEQPFAGLRVAVSVHLEAKTANLGYVLAKGGAEVRLTGSNPLSTQDDVAAGLADMGVETFGIHGAMGEEYENLLIETLKFKPHLVVDDGGDLIHLLGGKCADLGEHLIGGCEETTTGILRLKAREREGILPCAMMAVNDAKAKHYYDNKYGTGQSVWDAIMHTANLVVAGKTVVVAGYGWCGKGVAMRAAGMGASVIVTEVDPFKALDATMNGFRVMPMDEAARYGDIFVTVTGCKDVITPKHFAVMKHNAILTNAGHFDCEVDVAGARGAAAHGGTWRAWRPWRSNGRCAGTTSRASPCPTAGCSTSSVRGGWSTWPPATATPPRLWTCPSPSRPWPWSGWSSTGTAWRRRSTRCPPKSTTPSAGSSWPPWACPSTPLPPNRRSTSTAGRRDGLSAQGDGVPCVNPAACTTAPPPALYKAPVLSIAYREKSR